MRGCGSRVEGGIYFEVGVSLFGNGLNVEDVVICPPETDECGFHRSPKIISENPLIIAVWVGEKFYPSPYDFIYEAFQKGISRRVPTTFPFDKIKKPAFLAFHHPRARIKNWEEVVEALRKQGITKVPCPKKNQEHRNGHDCCLGLVQYFFPAVKGNTSNSFGVRSFRKVGDVSYPVYQPYDESLLPQPKFEAGFFMVTPLTRIVAVKKVSDSAKEKIMQSDYADTFEIVEE